MRANEFLIEGPKDWMQKQILGREQLDKAKVKRQNIPKIVDALQEILVTRVQQSDPKAIPKTITDALSKALKVDVTQHQEVFGDSVRQLITAMQAGRIDQVTDLLTAVVTKSYDVENSTGTAKLIAALKQKVEGMEPEEARKTIVELMIKQGRSLEAAEDIADEVLGPITPGPRADPEGEDEAEPAVPGQRVAKVYYPNGAYDENHGGEQLAFIQNNQGGWSMMQMSKENEWAMLDKVEAGKTQQDIIKIIRANQLEPVKLAFSLNQNDMWDVSKPPRAEK